MKHRKVQIPYLCAYLICFSLFFQTDLTWAQGSSAQTKYKRVAPKPGERCIICGVPLTEKDVTLIVRGRRVPLKHAMLDSFLNNEEKYFATLQPKSALFQENLEAPAGVAQGGITLGWFVFGLYVLGALVFAGMSGFTAVSKGLNPIPNFFIGLVFSVFGYLYVLTRPSLVNKGEIPAGLVKVLTTHTPVPCPKCGHTNHPSAVQCPSCGAALDPSMQSEVDRG
ncbi:MAG: hypothetical protein ACE5HO_20030 [bacterium]